MTEPLSSSAATPTKLGSICSAGLTALAVDVDGRVAISSAGLGTVVLDVHGAVILTLRAVAYDLVFDHHGNLIVVGEANGDGFIAKLDKAGNELVRETAGRFPCEIPVLDPRSPDGAPLRFHAPYSYLVKLAL
jgi:hypothetical protein